MLLCYLLIYLLIYLLNNDSMPKVTTYHMSKSQPSNLLTNPLGLMRTGNDNATVKLMPLVRTGYYIATYFVQLLH